MLSSEDAPEGLQPKADHQPRGEKAGKVEQGPELTEDQQKQLQALVEGFSDVFKEKPGKAKGVRHEMNTLKGTMERERWRTILHHLQTNVHQEIQKMMTQGVIIPFHSPW